MEPHERTRQSADPNEPEGLEDWLQDLRAEAREAVRIKPRPSRQRSLRAGLKHKPPRRGLVSFCMNWAWVGLCGRLRRVATPA